MNRRWTKEEIEILEEKYGYIKTSEIAKQLHRTIYSIKCKAQKLGFGALLENTHYISLPRFIETVNIDRQTLMRWSEKYCFPLRKKKHEKRTNFFVDPDEFWKWSKENKNMIEWDKFPKWSMGAEPDWVEVARNAAFKRLHSSKNSMKKTAWSKSEDEKLIYLLRQQKYTYPEISKEIGRTHGAIKRRMLDLKIKERPVYLDNHRPYKDDEVTTIIEMYTAGHGFDVIAEQLQRSEAGVRGKLERMGYKFRNRVLEKIN